MIRIENLSPETIEELERMSREERGTVAQRALLVLWAYQYPQSPREIAKRIGWAIKRVRKWLNRFLQKGIPGLYDASDVEGQAKQLGQYWKKSQGS